MGARASKSAVSAGSAAARAVKPRNPPPVAPRNAHLPQCLWCYDALVMVCECNGNVCVCGVRAVEKEAADVAAAATASAAAGGQEAPRLVDASTLPVVELDESLLQRQKEWVPDIKIRKEEVSISCLPSL